ncbi:MAG: hypothetical protein KDK41_00940 [Leptospiraceae bacterium]|nr:hypothetical protein [Leptospiraceae bacterium]
MKFIRHFTSIFFLGFLLNCGNDIPFDQENFLNRPVGLQVTALAGRQFQVSYSVQNQEKTFDGYNLYVARQTIGDGELDASVPALIFNGATPTFQHGPEDFAPNTVLTRVISGINFTSTLQFLCESSPPITYYFRIAAHSRKGIRSDPSNEVTAVCQP